MLHINHTLYGANEYDYLRSIPREVRCVYDSDQGRHFDTRQQPPLPAAQTYGKPHLLPKDKEHGSEILPQQGDARRREAYRTPKPLLGTRAASNGY